MRPRFEMESSKRRKVVEKHVCNETERWCRFETDLPQRAEAARSDCRDASHAIQREVEQIVVSEATAATDWPLFLEMRVQRIVSNHRTRSKERLYVGPSGLMIVSVCASPERIRTAFFPRRSANWRQTCRSLLNTYCQVDSGRYAVPGLSASFEKDAQCDTHFEDRRSDRVTLHHVEHFGFHRDGVTQQSLHSFPRWPEAERRGFDTTIAPAAKAVREVRTRNPKRPRNLG